MVPIHSLVGVFSEPAQLRFFDTSKAEADWRSLGVLQRTCYVPAVRVGNPFWQLARNLRTMVQVSYYFRSPDSLQQPSEIRPDDRPVAMARALKVRQRPGSYLP